MLLGFLAFGDVPYRCRDQDSLWAFQRAQADLDGKLGGVFPQPAQLQALTHQPRAGMRGVPLSMLRMLPSKSLWQQVVNNLPDQLLAAIAEQALRLRVYENDAPLYIRDDHGIRRGFENPTELDFASAQSLLGLFARRDIARDLAEAAQSTVLASQRSNQDIGPETGAILAHAPAFLLNQPLFCGDLQFLGRLVICYIFRHEEL